MPRENPRRKVRKTHHNGRVKFDASKSSAAITAAQRLARKGGLSLLPTLAIDILFEIFINFQPKDLINIMYTSREFRTLLVSPNFTVIWKAVRLNVVGFPECPADLSEIQYAKLAFDSHCYRCGERTSNGPQWEVRARFCDKCLGVVLIPITAERYRNITFPCDDLAPADLIAIIRFKLPNYTLCHFERQANELAILVSSSNDQSMQLSIAGAKHRVDIIREHAERFGVWEVEARNRDQQHLVQMKAQMTLKRREDIRLRLAAHGLGTAISNLPAGVFENHRLVNSATPLTDRIWNNINLSLVEWIQEQDKTRVARSSFVRYMSKHPDVLLPGIQEFLNIGEVEAILKNPKIYPAPRKLTDNVPTFIEKWRRKVTLKLADKATPGLDAKTDISSKNAKLAKLDLATTVFSFACTRRWRTPPHLKYMHYPWVMAHSCIIENASTQKGTSKLCQCKELRHEVKIGKTVIAPILEACNLSPTTTTSAHMDTLNARFICSNCDTHDPAGAFVTVYTWRTAIVHALICNNKKQGYSWKKLSDHAADRVKSSASNVGFTYIAGDGQRDAMVPQWGCKLCLDRGNTRAHTVNGVRSHILSEVHAGIEGRTGEEFYRLPRYPPGMFDTVISRHHIGI
ncbi:hypothetical protein BD410DRAFT_152450 [Rickenella mellea]|uniref:F-box domain-containing protein n=1 Tax=Rickenella mellea TaxID=50990 RepID=A0A4Y7Q913_9AGAM|nr:hypothetical protein BD410DRAFT_152450 [Rickenella mellea]